MREKILIFDSSSLITLSMNALINLLDKLNEKFKGKFIITPQVKYEIIERPMNIKKFELGALRINRLFEKKILELPIAIGISNEKLKQKIKDVLKITNKSYFARDEFMRIIHDGEASCLALSLLANEKNIENTIVVDERTTRMIVENPENLRKLFENKLHTKVDLKGNFRVLKNIRFIRSSELVYVAYKKKLISLGDGKLLDALLYATKYKGCSISRQEIEEAKRIK